MIVCFELTSQRRGNHSHQFAVFRYQPLGLSHIGENKAQEFRDKFSCYGNAVKHFIGRVQQNKLKYIVGKADAIDSVDSIKTAADISEFAKKLNVSVNVLIELNIG